MLPEKQEKALIPLIIVILYILIPWSNFFFRGINIWNGQGLFTQSVIILVFFLSSYYKPKYFTKNLPLSCLFIWTGIITVYYWYKYISLTNHYPIQIFLPFFNFLCFYILYVVCVRYLNKKNIETVFKYCRYSFFLILLYCILQYFQLDQFFIGTSSKDELVGTIGNPSHLAGLLALYQPFFFNKGRLNKVALFIIWVIIGLSNSASGLLVGALVFFYLCVMKRCWHYIGILIILLSVVYGLCCDNLETFFNFQGRIGAWKDLYSYFSQASITGSGMGILNIWQITDKTNSIWRHAHQEYFQFAIETGFIGLGFVIWCIIDWFKRTFNYRYDIIIKSSALFIGFLSLGFFTFPAHLWQLSMLGALGYTTTFIIEGYNDTNT